MPRAEPRLQRKLLVWLLGPLALLLVLDSGAAWWNALRFSHLAHDRALVETAREIGLHVQLDHQARPQLNLSPTAADLQYCEAEA